MSSDSTVHIRFTSAPESYDYCNTQTVCVVGKMKSGINKGGDLRKVAIRSGVSLAYQVPRYQSGLHLVTDLEGLEKIHDLVGEIDMNKARENL